MIGKGSSSCTLQLVDFNVKTKQKKEIKIELTQELGSSHDLCANIAQ